VLTPTHSLLALAVLARRNRPKQNLSILAGSLLPDAFIYVAWIIYMIMGKTQSEIWDMLYFQNPVQFWDAFLNSFPIYLGVVVIGWLLSRREFPSTKLIGQCAFGLGLAALIHLGTDMPVHASDAHRHFWPVSDWRFYSPLSYWETDHHATLVTFCEALLGIFVCVILWRRFNAKWVRIILGLFTAFYIVLSIGTLLFMTGIIGASA